MPRKRQSFTPSFEAEVALEAIRETESIAEIAQKHQLHPAQINFSKKQLLDGAENLFQDGRSEADKATTDEAKSAKLYEQIDHLKVQLEWLNKVINR